MDFYRPLTFDDYHGQEKMKDVLNVHIQSALEREAVMEHVLLYGPPGCGKTTIARIIADSLQADFMSFVMPIKEQVLKRLVTSFDGVVLFDEIHRMPPRQQETLLPLIEDDYLQLDTGAMLHAGALTVVGATTELDKVIAPLWDRFQIKPPFDDYSDEEMSHIVMGMAETAEISIDRETAMILGRATGGIPRNAKAFVNMARDLGTSDPNLILEKCRVTKDGFQEMHMRYLYTLNNCGGAAGLEIIGAHLGIPKTSIIDLERLLVRRKMIEYTKQGRSLLGPGWSLTKKGKHK